MSSAERSGQQRSTGTFMVVVLVLAAAGIALFTLFEREPTADRQENPVAESEPTVEKPVVATASKPGLSEEARFVEARKEMLEDDLRGRDITDARVLRAMSSVPRQLFVPEELKHAAYADGPLPIGHGQTISQPYIVALMTQLVDPKPESKALDVGTGSGYQAAVLAELCEKVYGIEIVKPLADTAKQRLDEVGYENVTVRHGDGYGGWPEHAPFDVIIVAAAPDHVPQALIDQLAPGGRLVIPVGRFYQELIYIEKQTDGTVRRKSVAGVAFVPMTGKAEEGARK